MDWLFLLKRENDSMFQLHATEDVFAEVASNMRKNHPRLPGHVVRRRVELMQQSVDEVLETFPGDLPFTGTDEDDYHIHVAAIHCQADLILTNNSPSDITTGVGTHYEIISPDDFFVLIAKSALPRMLYPIIKDQIAYWSKKSKYQQLDEALRHAKCPEFADMVLTTLQKWHSQAKYRPSYNSGRIEDFRSSPVYLPGRKVRLFESSRLLEGLVTRPPLNALYLYNNEESGRDDKNTAECTH